MENKHDINAEKQSLKDKLMAIILLETSKNYREMDSALVTECVDFLMELEGKEKLTKEEIEQKVNAIPFKGKMTAIDSYIRKKIRLKRIAVIAAVLAVIVSLFGIIAVASGGDSALELTRTIAKTIIGMVGGSSAEYGNITVLKPTEAKLYSSIEEFAKDEEIEFLYPTWLPENEKIVSVLCDAYEYGTEYTFISSTPEYSIGIRLESELDEEVKSNSNQKEIAGYTVYYFETELFIQGEFVYKNKHYFITTETEEDLFKIIENMKEIN